MRKKIILLLLGITMMSCDRKMNKPDLSRKESTPAPVAAPPTTTPTENKPPESEIKRPTPTPVSTLTPITPPKTDPLPTPSTVPLKPLPTPTAQNINWDGSSDVITDRTLYEE